MNPKVPAKISQVQTKEQDQTNPKPAAIDYLIKSLNQIIGTPLSR